MELRQINNQTDSIVYEPKTTPSVLAAVPECLRQTLERSVSGPNERRKSILISSNSLANRFILERWGIRPSQRKRFRNLFATVRRQSRDVFKHYLARGRIEWNSNGNRHIFGIFRYDEIRGNLILGFVSVPPGAEWKLPIR
ncbi:MAG: hypothetical protein RTU92_03380 [Candidatus Thorarchaeota archaeon]